MASDLTFSDDSAAAGQTWSSGSSELRRFMCWPGWPGWESPRWPSGNWPPPLTGPGRRRSNWPGRPHGSGRKRPDPDGDHLARSVAAAEAARRWHPGGRTFPVRGHGSPALRRARPRHVAPTRPR